MKNTLKIFLAVAALGAASTASAIKYEATDLFAGPSGMTVSATGGSLVVGNKNGLEFLGVSGGETGDEIDDGQSVSIVFDTPAYIQSIVLGLLFDGPEYKDYQEIAIADADGNIYSLQATGETTALWSYAGATVNNISAAVVGASGVWEIINPFATAVTSLTFYPQDSVPPQDVYVRDYSDFGLVSITVPDASSTMALLGMGLVGLAFVARRSRR